MDDILDCQVVDNLRRRLMARRTGSSVAAPEERIGFLLYRAGLAVAQAYEAQMRPSGFTPGEVGVLTHLASHGAGHIREVGRSLGVSPQTVINLARGLEAKGMLLRTGSSADRRTVILEVTEVGRNALLRADEIACRFDRAIERVVGKDAQSTSRALRRLLEKNANWAAPSEGAADEQMLRRNAETS